MPTLEDAAIQIQSAIETSDDVVRELEAAYGTLPDGSTASTSTSSTEGQQHAQGLESHEELQSMFSAFAGKLEVRSADTSGPLARLHALGQVFTSLTVSGNAAPVETQDYRAHAESRADYFDTMGSVITRLAADDRIQLASVDLQQLEELKKLSEALRHSAKNNPFTGKDAPQHHAHRMAAREIAAQNALQTLLHGHLPELLSEIVDPKLLTQLANDLLKKIDRCTSRRSSDAEPTRPNGWGELVESVRAEIQLATAEMDLQKNLLEVLRNALQELGEAKVDGLRGGLNHRTRQMLGAERAQKYRIDHRPRGERVRDSISEHLGTYFDVEVSKEHKDKLDMSVKQASVGSITMSKLHTQLDGWLQLDKPEFIPKAIRATVDHTAEFELSQKSGKEHVSLIESAQKRLNDLRLATLGNVQNRTDPSSSQTPATQHTAKSLVAGIEQCIEQLARQHDHHGSERYQDALTQASHTLRAFIHLAEMPPQKRLAQAATRAIDIAQLGVLKLSLLRSFGDQIHHEKVDEALDHSKDKLHPHPGLTQQKARLLLDMWPKVLGSHTKQEMLAHVDEVDRTHHALWHDTWQRPHGGRTAELLQDLRSAVDRF